jgi:hypothetical protein
VDFVLRANGALDGTLRNRSIPLAGGWVEAIGGDGKSHSESLSDGRFHLPLSGGKYWVSARGSNGQMGFVTAEPVVVELPPGAVRELALDLVPCTVVRVRLTDVGSNPAFVEVEAVDPMGRCHVAERVDESVRTLLLVPPGPFLLRASPMLEGRQFEKPLDLTGAGSELEVEFKLE